jgi:hypothetical protein
MKLPADCPYATSSLDRLAGDAPGPVAFCRPCGWRSSLSSGEQRDVMREIIKAIQPENDDIEAVARDMATD